MGKNDILINVLLDRSGSMSHLVNDVIGHYNTYIGQQRGLPGKATVSLVIFDTEYQEVYLGQDINLVPTLTKDTYFARGGTAYLDALGRLIKSVDAIPNKPKKVVFVVNTDGEENSSHEYNAKTIKEMVTERQNNHDWQFVFVGAGIDALKEAAKIGIRNFSTFTTTADAAGMDSSYNTLRSATTDYRSGVGASGQSVNAMIMTNDHSAEAVEAAKEKKPVKKKTTGR